MIRHQQLIYKLILGFSAIVNLFLLGLLFFVLRDSLSGRGNWFLILEGKSLWYFVGIVLIFSILNAVFIIQLFKKTSDIGHQTSDIE
ncbi:hypothetical protein [Epilithonimonas xixisoli]|uniref:hypothetical protein n=1 Tax=Epilithonimonas xixisoli TaxID=1476462 RepID=UPI0010632DD0|nr:hypothetical protein [Epilithonimonas xixisoli]